MTIQSLRPLRRLIVSVGFLVATALPPGAAVAADDLPGEGRSIKMARGTWDSGWLQAEIYRKALEDLGYDVAPPMTLDVPPFYQAVGQGDVDLWVNGWFPGHDPYRDSFEPGAEVVGYVAKGGAVQGYLVDKQTAEAHGITSVEDFKNPEIRALFDSDGDGRAEMVACPPGWDCERTIAHHLDAYDLHDHVEPIKAAYAAAMADAIGKHKNGESIFFYTWTPNWTVGLLEPGKDVVWIQVAFPSLPEEQKDFEDATTIAGVAGCVANPCALGWPANDIRPVANVQFLDENPAVRKLLEVMGVPLAAINAQNARMNAGEDTAADLDRHAREWIEQNRERYDDWLEQAKAAAAN